MPIPGQPTLQNLLVADPDEHLRRVLALALPRFGWHPTLVATADQLLHAAQACEATVAVLDSELLPDHAVTELAQQLLLVPTRLLLTTWDPSYSVLSSSRPSSPVLRKPFSIQTLLTSLELCGRGNQ